MSADEFRLTLSRASIRRGPAIVELVNYGEDDHDLALRRVGGTRTYRIGLVHPGTTGELDTRLRRGPLRRCGARSPTTAPAACARRCSCAERRAHQLPGDGGSAVPGGVIT